MFARFHVKLTTKKKEWGFQLKLYSYMFSGYKVSPLWSYCFLVWYCFTTVELSQFVVWYCFTIVEHLKLNYELLLLWHRARLVKQSDSSIRPLLTDNRCFCRKVQVVGVYFLLSRIEQNKSPRHPRDLKWYIGFNWLQDGIDWSK